MNIDFVPLVREFCESSKTFRNIIDTGNMHMLTRAMGFINDLQKNATGLCGELSIQPALSPEIAVHANCCIGDLLSYHWLSLEPRQNLAYLSAKSLVLEMNRLESCKKGVTSLSKKEEEKIKTINDTLTRLAQWAKTDLPKPKVMGDYIVPVQCNEWDKFFKVLKATDPERRA